MATYKQVAYGSQGSDVKSLQEMLNTNGYKLDVDGIFGVKTQAAVKDYQKKNNLAVDGIVGTNTWGALTKVSPNAATTTNATTTAKKTPSTTDPNIAAIKSNVATIRDNVSQNNATQNNATQNSNFTYQQYQESDAVKQAQALLQQQLDSKPGAYQSQWQTQLDEAMNKILNREKFSYDLNGDALYQQYKDQYMLQGQQAMMDTMGQAAMMTGGYGNSYAQSVGQQAYQGQLQNLNNIVPELYQMALDKYQMEGQDLYNQYGLIADKDNQDYGRYRDQVSDWNAETNRLQNQYNTERDFDYGKYADDRNFNYGQFVDDRNFQYQQDRDAVADSQWDKSFQYQQDRDAIADSQWEQSFQYQQDRDKVSDSQWEQSFQYQQDRDKVSDSQWQQQFDEALRQYNESFQYQKDRDAVADSQWNQSFQYQQDRDKVADSQWDQSFQYQQDRDKVSDSQWDQSFEYQQGRDEVADSQWQKEFEEAQRQFNVKNNISTSTGSSSSSSSSGGGGGYNTHGYTAEQIKQLQQAAGIKVDGIWGPQTEAAYNSGYRPTQEQPKTPATDTSVYTGLLNSVSTAKGAYSKQSATERQAAYKEAVENINDAYNRGAITAAQKAELLKIATPSAR